MLVSIAAGIIGSVVVIDKMSFAAGGVAHGAYAGVGVAFFAGFAPFLGALGAAVILGLLIAFFSFEKNERFDSLMGAIWAFGMALGIVFSELSDGYTSDLMSYLFGSILAVSKADLALMTGFDLLFLLFAMLSGFVVVFYHGTLTYKCRCLVRRQAHVGGDLAYLCAA